MGCSSCGGGGVSPKMLQRRAVRAAHSPLSKQMRTLPPANSQRVVRSQSQTVLKAKTRAAGMRQCPTCGAGVRTVMAGTGPKRRLVCSSCGNQFSKS